MSKNIAEWDRRWKVTAMDLQSKRMAGGMSPEETAKALALAWDQTQVDFLMQVKSLADRLDLSESTIQVLMDSPVGLSQAKDFDSELKALPREAVTELQAALAKHAGKEDGANAETSQVENGDVSERQPRGHEPQMDLSDHSDSRNGEEATILSVASGHGSGESPVLSKLAQEEVEVVVPETPDTPQNTQTILSTWSQDRQTLMDRVQDLVNKGEISQARLADFQRANPIPGDGQLQCLTAVEAEEFQDNWNEVLSTWVGSQLADDGQRFASTESLLSVSASDAQSVHSSSHEEQSSSNTASASGLSHSHAVQAESDMEEEMPDDDVKLTIEEIVEGGKLDDPAWLNDRTVVLQVSRANGFAMVTRDRLLDDLAQIPGLNIAKDDFFGIAEAGSGEWELYCFQKRTAQALADKGTFQYLVNHEVIMHRLGKELTTIRVHWLPLRVTKDDLVQWVSNYSQDIHSIVNEVSVAPKAAGLLTGIRRIRCILDKGVNKMTVPYDTEILARDGNTYRILISIDGRRPKCLKCGRIGHIRKRCKAIKCPVCREWTEDHDGSTCPRRARKQPNARMVPMEPYGSAGQQATGLSSSQMASAMEEEWIQVTNKKKRKQQAHPAGSTSTPASPARPQTPQKPAKKSKVGDKSQPKNKQKKVKSSSQAPGASPASPPPQPIPNVNDPNEFPVAIPKSPTANKAKTPYVQQIQAAPTVTPLNLVPVPQVKSSSASPRGAEGKTAAPPAAPVKKAPGVKQPSGTGTRKTGGLVVKRTTLTHASPLAKANPKTKLRSAAQTPPKRMANSSHSGSSAASTKPPRHKVFRH